MKGHRSLPGTSLVHLAPLEAPTIAAPLAVNVAPGPQRAPRLRRCTQEDGSQRLSNRLDPSDGCCRRKEHRKKVRFIRPPQSEAEQGDQRNYSELPYFGVQSVLSLLPSPHDTFEQDGWWSRRTRVLGWHWSTDLSGQNNDLAASPQILSDLGDRTC
jgi:hypothetical protein